MKLQTKPLQVLEALLTRPGEVVTREELCKKLWPSGTFVDFESGLNTATNRLRTALGDSADAPRYIETLPRLGYRFICPVSEKVHEIRDHRWMAARADASVKPEIQEIEISRSDTSPSIASAAAPVEAVGRGRKLRAGYRAIAAALLVLAVILVLAYLRSKAAVMPLQQGVRQTTIRIAPGLVRLTQLVALTFVRP